jgi:hypothetical protein
MPGARAAVLLRDVIASRVNHGTIIDGQSPSTIDFRKRNRILFARRDFLDFFI